MNGQFFKLFSGGDLNYISLNSDELTSPSTSANSDGSDFLRCFLGKVDA